MPIALDDPWYDTAVDTNLTIGTSDTTLLDNDWDVEGDTITASVVDNPANGTLTTFNNDGTFTYSPDTTFTGIDTFTYKLSDGTRDSNIATVSIAVGGDFGPRTNVDEITLDAPLHVGSLVVSQPLTLGFGLNYRSDTQSDPIVVLETTLLSSASVPDSIDAQLTFGGVSNTTISYDTTGLSAGDPLRFALMADASTLDTGYYDWDITLTSWHSGNDTTRTYSGSRAYVDRSDSEFGPGWGLDGLDRLYIETGGVLLVEGDGDALWYADDGGGGFEPAVGDPHFATLVQNVDDSYTLTSKYGIERNFADDGLLTSIVDTNDNTTSFTYTDGDSDSAVDEIWKVTDPFTRVSTFAYSSNLVSSFTDIASEATSLAYTSGKLTKVTHPDPDGAGSQAAPETEYDYHVTAGLLDEMTNALDNVTSYAYHSTSLRLSTITFPDNNTISFTPVQPIGLPTGTSGQTLSSPSAAVGSVTDERSKQSDFTTNRFGSFTTWTDPLDNDTIYEYNAHGQLARLTEEDPDGAGSQTSPITKFGYSADGDLVKQVHPDNSESEWTYNSTLHRILSVTDELDRTTEYTYDTDGNLETIEDPAGNTWTYVNNSTGLPTSLTSPDPDGAGPLAALVTEYTYDTNGRLTTLTHPDDETIVYAYDSADNLTSITDERSKVTSYTYDDLNRLTKVTDRTSAETEYAYNALGLMTKMTDALDNVTDYTYNNRNWLTKIERPDPDGAGSLERPTSTYGYDATGNLTSVGEPLFADSPLVHSYDDAGRRTSSKRITTALATEYSYDDLNRLTKVTDPLEYNSGFEYDSRGRVTKVLGHDDGTGASPIPETVYTYDAAGQLSSVTDRRGYKTLYFYNSRGLLEWLNLADPDGAGPLGRPTTYHTYDNLGRLIKTQDTLQRVTTYEYDSRGRVTKRTDPDPDFGGPLASPVTQYAYDAANRLTSITDPLSRVTSYAYDDEGRVTSITLPDPDGAGSQSSPVYSYVYNAMGSVTKITDPLSGETTFAYDTLQRRTSMTQPDPDGAGGQSAPVTSYTYNDQGVLSKITDPLSRDTTFDYDVLGRRTGVTDELSNKTTYAYDDVDQVTSITQPDPDGAGAQASPVTSYTYDEYGRMKQVTDPNSGKTSFSYDDEGNLLTLTDPELNATTFAYDGLGRLTMETNELDDSRSFYYDAAGMLARRVDRNDGVIQFDYDELNRVVEEAWYDNGTPVPTISIATTTEGGPIDEVQRVGFTGFDIDGGTFTLTYDGQTTSAITYNASAAAVQSALEALSNIGAGDVSVVKTLDTTDEQEWQLTFTGALAATDVAQTTVDSTNVTTMMLEPVTDIEETDVTGGVFDEVQTVTLANEDGGTFRLAFEGETSAPLDHDATAAEVDTALEDLNSIDTVSVTGNAGGPWTVTFTGNHADTNVDRLNGDAASLTAGTEVHTIIYVYDAASQLTSASDDDSGYDYTYDDLGRMLTIDNDDTPNLAKVVLTYAYDAASNRTSAKAKIGTTDDFENSYTYDALHRLTRLDQVEQTGGNTVAEKRVDFAYNAIGLFTSIARYNDTDGASGDEVATSSYTYDTLGRLTDLANKNGGNNLFTPYEWTYDDLNRVTQFVSADGTTDYTYDDASQLTAADHTYQTDESYSYDDNGNRTMTGYTSGTNNQLTNDGTHSYTYDDEGNRLTRTHDTTDYVTEYEWDHRNRLVMVTDKDDLGATTQVVEYKYDLYDRRIEKAVDTTSPFTMTDAAVERYVYDGDGVVFQFDGDQASDLTHRFLHGPVVDQILAQEDVSENISSVDRVLWQLADNLGTVRDLAKNDGTLGEHYKYDAFGNIQSGDTSVTRYLFNGREFDADTELQYNRTRWYDAAVGRWISEDPIGFSAGDVNLARFRENNVTNRGRQANSDPLGLVATTVNRSQFTRTAVVFPATNTTEHPMDIIVQHADNPLVIWGFMPPEVMAPAPDGGGDNWDALDYIANASAGFGDALSFGGTDALRDAMGINDGIDHDSLTYVGGEVAGTAVGIAIGGGAGTAKAGSSLAVRAANAYVIAGDVHGVALSSYHAATGEFTAADTAGFLPAAGWIGGRMSRVARGLEHIDAARMAPVDDIGCFVAGTPIITRDAGRTAKTEPEQEREQTSAVSFFVGACVLAATITVWRIHYYRRDSDRKKAVDFVLADLQFQNDLLVGLE